MDAIQSLCDVAEAENFLGELIRAVRQGLYFGLETRLPHMLVSILRPRLFNKPARPILSDIKFGSQQAMQHGYILARIAVLYKVVETGLAKMGGKGAPEEWHTFVAGCFAGYMVMGLDSSEPKLKKQINMAIGIRTLYALGKFALRKDCIPILRSNPRDMSIGRSVWYTLMWGAVMWHWKHQSHVGGEMEKSQVTQMNTIYTVGDVPGLHKWTDNKQIHWAIALYLLSSLAR
eukprot:m.66072 g.66072  ORF g.66072 m.66072 type:complete len:232 (+) comp23640_c0_seq1:194-889(+)